MRVLSLLLLCGVALYCPAQDTLSVPVRAAQEALRSATPEEYSERAIDLATAFRGADMPDSALAAAERALRSARNDRERSRAHFAVARALSKKQDNPGAQKHARETILLARATKDTAMWIRGAGVLAEVDMQHSRFEAALPHVRLVHQLALATKDTAAMATAHTYLGTIFYHEQNYDSARWHYDASIAFIPRTEPQRRLVVRMNQVNLFIEEERYDSAMARSDAMRTEVEGANMYTRSKYYNQRGYALYNAGRFREAIREFALSDSLNDAEVKELSLRIENTGFLAESYAAIGDSSKGYLLLLDLEMLKDSFAGVAANEQMLRLEKQFETRLSKEEIVRLNNENEQKAERLRVQKRQLLGSLALVALAIGAVVLIWRNLAQKRKHASVLEGLNAELGEKQTRIEEINGLLRLKVLRTQMNPHFIYNSLNAIHHLVRKGDNAAAGHYLDGFARLLRMVLDHSLKEKLPLEEELIFLRQYLMMEALRFAEGIEFSVEADPQLLEDDVLVPALLVQPFLENAVWHGLAPKEGEKKVTVRFTERAGKVVCTVEDNGVGRHAAPKREHPDGSASVGLQLTNERLQLLAYKLEGADRVVFTDLMDGERPAGTRVEVVLG